MPFIHPAVWQPGCVTEGLELRPIITQCFPLATSFRAISPLTAARGWQAITKPRFCSRGSILKQTQKLLCSRTGRIRASKSSSISSVRTCACHFDTIIVQGLHDSQDRRMVPALGKPSPIRRGSLPRPRRRPRRRGGERRWGGDASASPGSGSVERRGRFRPHHGGGRRRSCAIANPGRADVAARRGPGPGVGHTPSKTSRLQPAPLIGGDDRPSSPRQDGILTLKSFMIPYVICRLTAQVGWL
jgi:hypothetical protein